MAKWSRIHSGGSSSSVADVTVNSTKKAVRILFDDGDKRIFPLSECPKNIRTGTMMVRMNEKRNKVYSVYPSEGMFVGKVKEFVHQQDKPPTPNTNTTWDYQYFVCIIEITKGECKGMNIPYILRYNFGEVDVDGKAAVGFTHPKSKYTAQLEDFLDIVGAMEKPMKYADNILPMLEKRILLADKTFSFVIKGGYISTVFTHSGDSGFVPKEESDDSFDLADDDDDVDEENIPWE